MAAFGHAVAGHIEPSDVFAIAAMVAAMGSATFDCQDKHRMMEFDVAAEHHPCSLRVIHDAFELAAQIAAASLALEMPLGFAGFGSQRKPVASSGCQHVTWGPAWCEEVRCLRQPEAIGGAAALRWSRLLPPAMSAMVAARAGASSSH